MKFVDFLNREIEVFASKKEKEEIKTMFIPYPKLERTEIAELISMGSDEGENWIFFLDITEWRKEEYEHRLNEICIEIEEGECSGYEWYLLIDTKKVG